VFLLVLVFLQLFLLFLFDLPELSLQLRSLPLQFVGFFSGLSAHREDVILRGLANERADSASAALILQILDLGFGFLRQVSRFIRQLFDRWREAFLDFRRLVFGSCRLLLRGGCLFLCCRGPVSYR